MASGSRAVISNDGFYRYCLVRQWGRLDSSLARYATFIMLNPSKADAFVDDPTVRRCVGFAKLWGCDGLRVVNLFALRSTDPKALWSAENPIGSENNDWLRRYAMDALRMRTPLVAGWGAVPYQRDMGTQRVREVLGLQGMTTLQALGVTKDGFPRHPLYVRNDAELIAWPQEQVA